MVGAREEFYREVSVLRRQLDECREENRQLRRALGEGVILWPSQWQLSPQQGRLLEALYRSPSGFRSTDGLHTALYDQYPETMRSIVRTVLRHVRRKVPADVRIEAVHGRGYRLTAASRAFLRTIIEAEP